MFPDSWHPDGFPPSQMLTVPSCRACNAMYQKHELRVLLPLAAALPRSKANDSVVERAIRGAEPAAGRTVNEVLASRRSRSKLHAERPAVVPFSDTERGMWSPTRTKPGPVRTPAGLLVENAVCAVKYDRRAMRALADQVSQRVLLRRTRRPNATRPALLVGELRRGSSLSSPSTLKNLPGYVNHGRPPFEWALVTSDTRPRSPSASSFSGTRSRSLRGPATRRLVLATMTRSSSSKSWGASLPSRALGGRARRSPRKSGHATRRAVR